jgi:hypothetical protein
MTITHVRFSRGCACRLAGALGFTAMFGGGLLAAGCLLRALRWPVVAAVEATAVVVATAAAVPATDPLAGVRTLMLRRPGQLREAVPVRQTIKVVAGTLH